MIHKSNEEVSSRYGVKQKMTNDSRFSKKDGNGCGEHRGVNSVTYKSGGWCTQVDDQLLGIGRNPKPTYLHHIGNERITV